MKGYLQCSLICLLDLAAMPSLSIMSTFITAPSRTVAIGANRRQDMRAGPFMRTRI
jgi:hypothetical protein